MVLVTVLGTAAVAGAFDGQRQGFILGVGGGAGLTSYTQTIAHGGGSVTSDRENEFPLMTDFRIGYAPSDALEIYWMSKVSWFSMENAYGDDVTIANGLGGLGVTYFLQPTAPSVFLAGGVGFSSWAAPLEEGVEAWYGLGVSAGAGYEFAPHWYIQGDVCWGNPSTEEGGDDFSTNALSVKLTLNVMGY
jgi:hypothetical protein